MYYWYPYAQTAQVDREPGRREGRIFSEELLSSNLGRLVTIYLTYENNPQWNAKVITGTLRLAGRDFVLLRDQKTGKDQLLFNINIDFIVFEDRSAAVPGREGVR